MSDLRNELKDSEYIERHPDLLDEIEGQTEDPASGLLPEEMRIAETVVDIFRAFNDLPVQHPDDLAMVKEAVHRVQELLALRVMRRHFPAYWKTNP